MHAGEAPELHEVLADVRGSLGRLLHATQSRQGAECSSFPTTQSPLLGEPAVQLESRNPKGDREHKLFFLKNMRLCGAG